MGGGGGGGLSVCLSMSLCVCLCLCRARSPKSNCVSTKPELIEDKAIEVNRRQSAVSRQL